MRCPVRMHKRARHAALQLDDGEAEGAHCDTAAAVDRAAPLELGRGGQAELVGEVSLLVMVLTVLVLVESQEVGAILVHVGPVFTFLPQFEQVVQVYDCVPFGEAET